MVVKLHMKLCIGHQQLVLLIFWHPQDIIINLLFYRQFFQSLYAHAHYLKIYRLNLCPSYCGVFKYKISRDLRSWLLCLMRAVSVKKWAPSVKNISEALQFRGLHCVKELCISGDHRSLMTTTNLIGFQKCTNLDEHELIDLPMDQHMDLSRNTWAIFSYYIILLSLSSTCTLGGKDTVVDNSLLLSFLQCTFYFHKATTIYTCSMWKKCLDC